MISEQQTQIIDSELYNDFLQKYAAYMDTDFIDKLREQDFSRMEENGHVYLDFVGSSLYPKSLIDSHHEFLLSNIYGNPHSENPTSRLATDHCECAREHVKQYFNDKDDEYIVVFTANASGSLKLVGESYPFSKDCHYALLVDNHNSVNGIREFARCKGASFDYVAVQEDTLQIDDIELQSILKGSTKNGNKLFAYPAQSNFSGVKHDLGWIAKAQAEGWDVLLDAAAFVPTNKLDLSIYKPEFVSLSFYKIFGYPTGIGCLLIKKSVLGKLNRPWFAGGTIQLASVRGDGHFFSDNEAAFEDGTINFLGIPAIEMGLKYISNIGIENIQKRTSALAQWTLDQLLPLKHDNGEPLIDLYGTADLKHRGATLTFNIKDTTGKTWFFEDVEQLANKEMLSVRAGCFCNPGLSEIVGKFTSDMLRPVFECGEKTSFHDFVHEKKENYVVGAIRASLGYISNFNDAARLVTFVKSFLNK